MDDLRKKFIAYHEAGHAVVALHEGLDVEWVSIATEPRAVSLRFQPGKLYSTGGLIRNLMAGHEAQYIQPLPCMRLNDFCGEDRAMVEQIAAESGADLMLLREQTKVLVHKLAPAIHVLAEALMIKPTFTGAEVRHILEGMV